MHNRGATSVRAAAPAAPPRVAILGSCVSRDAFGPEPQDHGVDIPACIMRTGLISISGTSLEADGIVFDGATKFESRAALTELSKTAFDQLEAARPQWVVVDFIDERFDLRLFENGALVAASPVLLERSNLLQAVRGSVRIPRHWSAVQGVALNAIPKLKECLARIVPEERTIIHRALWARTSFTNEGVVSPPPGRLAYIDAQNANLRALYNHFQAVAPRAAVIDVPEALCVADSSHRWGPAPFHYIPSYYEAYKGQLKSIIETAATGHARPAVAFTQKQGADEAGPGGEDDAISALFKRLTKEARAGDPDLALRLGRSLLNDGLLPAHPALAFELFVLACLHGNEEAVLDVGICLIQGQGTEKDVQLGLEWLRLAERRGYGRAHRVLAELHLEGRHVAKREDLARILLRRAAEKGDALAADRLAWLFETGIGGPPDAERARYWRREASRLASPRSVAA